MKLILEQEKYYIPIYCYRHFPSSNDIYEKIINDLINYKKIEIYENEEKAWENARKQLCGHDCCDVAILDFSCGWCKAYFENTEKHNKINLYRLNPYVNCYKILK